MPLEMVWTVDSVCKMTAQQMEFRQRPQRPVCPQITPTGAQVASNSNLTCRFLPSVFSHFNYSLPIPDVSIWLQSSQRGSVVNRKIQGVQQCNLLV